MDEPISPEPPAAAGRTLITQSWLDVALLHWEVEPEQARRLLPAGTEPDLLDGRTYAGLFALRMERVGWFGFGVPYFGTFPETNVRLYSVDERGRRGVAFRSMDAARLLPVVIARSGVRLPYAWSRMSIRREGNVVSYTCRRRWPQPRGARSRISVRIGEPIAEPTELEHFLTARWGLHNEWFGRTVYLPNTHPRWPLHRAELLSCDDELIGAAGIEPCSPVVSVMYAPGVPVRFGPPAAV